MSYISNIPDELLLSIIECSVFYKNDYTENTCSDCASVPSSTAIKTLMLVSRRFKRIVQPCLYHTPFSMDSGNYCVFSEEMVRFRDVLRSNPDMCSHVKVLHVYLDWPGYDEPQRRKNEFEILQEILTRATKIRCLRFDGGVGEDEDDSPTEALVKLAIKCLPDVRHCHFSNGGLRENGKNLPLSMIDPSWEKLVRLDISDFRIDFRGEWPAIPSRCATFTALSFTNCFITARNHPSWRNIIPFIQWPAKLEHFKWTTKYNTGTGRWQRLFQDNLIQYHRATLRTVKIITMKQTKLATSLFDATQSPNLTHLRLSAPPAPPTSSWQQTNGIKFFGPNLKLFTCDFLVYNESRNEWSSFGKTEEGYLRSLATASVTQNAAVERIHVVFNPSGDGRDDTNPWNHYSSLSEWYPWELMDRIRDEVLRPSGRELTYDKPPFASKEEWQRDFVAEVKQRENRLRREIEDETRSRRVA